MDIPNILLLEQELIFPYTPSIDDVEKPGYREYLWQLAKNRREAHLKAYGEAASVEDYYKDFLSNSDGAFNYRRWYNTTSDEELLKALNMGTAHWRDADDKTYLSPTFSVESPYSGYPNPYNPKGISGGSWEGELPNDKYIFSDSQIDNDWDINRTLEEFLWSRENEKMEDGTPVNTRAVYKGGQMLPEIVVLPNKKATGGSMLEEDPPIAPKYPDVPTKEAMLAYLMAFEEYLRLKSLYDKALQQNLKLPNGEELQRFAGETQEDYENRYKERVDLYNLRTAEADKRFEARQQKINDIVKDVDNNVGLVVETPKPPFTEEAYKEAAEYERLKLVNKAHDYKNIFDATLTAAELGMSGASLFGAYTNWKKWKDLASLASPTATQLAKARIANLLLKALLPMLVGGTVIDAYLTYDALNNDDTPNAIYNGVSMGLGALGSVGASDVFLNSRFHSPKIDRLLDVLGITLNTGDFLKFGYDMYNNTTKDDNKKATGGTMSTPLDWNELTMKLKAVFIRKAILSKGSDNSITIDDIKSLYDKYKNNKNLYEDGGKKKKSASRTYIDLAKEAIRRNEGFLSRPYADGPKGTGWRSVGYGFNDSGFRSKYPQGISNYYLRGITREQAELELEYILSSSVIPTLRKKYGSKWDLFNDNQKAAIIDTYYQRPASVIGRNSRFYLAVMNDDPNAGKYLGVAGFNKRNSYRLNLFNTSTLPQQTNLPIDYETLNLLFPEEDPNVIVLDKMLPEVVVTAEAPLEYIKSSPQAFVALINNLQDLLNNLMVPYEPVEVPKPVSVTDTLTLINLDRNTLLSLDLENSIARATKLGMPIDNTKLSRDLWDLNFYRNMTANGGKLFRFGGNEDEVEKTLPTQVVTPRGNYILYTGNESSVPTIKDYFDAKANESRINAANHIIHLRIPNIPTVPSRELISVVSGIMGMSDEERIKRFGTSDVETCIYTATSLFNDEGAKVSGNVTFNDAPLLFGFTPVSIGDIQEGDLMQFTANGRPTHSALVTGFNMNGEPVLSYSRGGTEEYGHYWDDKYNKEIFKPTMAYDNEMNNVLNSFEGFGTYRYTGSDSQKLNWAKEYSNKFNVPYSKVYSEVLNSLYSKPSLGKSGSWAFGGPIGQRANHIYDGTSEPTLLMNDDEEDKLYNIESLTPSRVFVHSENTNNYNIPGFEKVIKREKVNTKHTLGSKKDTYREVVYYRSKEFPGELLTYDLAVNAAREKGNLQGLEIGIMGHRTHIKDNSAGYIPVKAKGTRLKAYLDYTTGEYYLVDKKTNLIIASSSDEEVLENPLLWTNYHTGLNGDPNLAKDSFENNRGARITAANRIAEQNLELNGPLHYISTKDGELIPVGKLTDKQFTKGINNAREATANVILLANPASLTNHVIMGGAKVIFDPDYSKEQYLEGFNLNHMNQPVGLIQGVGDLFDIEDPTLRFASNFINPLSVAATAANSSIGDMEFNLGKGKTTLIKVANPTNGVFSRQTKPQYQLYSNGAYPRGNHRFGVSNGSYQGGVNVQYSGSHQPVGGSHLENLTWPGQPLYIPGEVDINPVLFNFGAIPYDREFEVTEAPEPYTVEYEPSGYNPYIAWKIENGLFGNPYGGGVVYDVSQTPTVNVNYSNEDVNRRRSQGRTGNTNPIYIKSKLNKTKNTDTSNKHALGGPLVELVNKFGGGGLTDEEDEEYVGMTPSGSSIFPYEYATVTAPRKYIARYDEDGNPVYTTDQGLSMSANVPLTPEELKRKLALIDIKNRPAGQLTGAADVASKVAQMGIGAALIPVAAAPLVEGIAPALRGAWNVTSSSATPYIQGTWNTISPYVTPYVQGALKFGLSPVSSIAKGVSSYVPLVASQVSKVMPYLQAAEKTGWGLSGAMGLYNNYNDWKEGNKHWGNALAEGALEGMMMAELSPALKEGYNIAEDASATALGNNPIVKRALEAAALTADINPWPAIKGYFKNGYFMGKNLVNQPYESNHFKNTIKYIFTGKGNSKDAYFAPEGLGFERANGDADGYIRALLYGEEPGTDLVKLGTAADVPVGEHLQTLLDRGYKPEQIRVYSTNMPGRGKYLSPNQEELNLHIADMDYTSRGADSSLPTTNGNFDAAGHRIFNVGEGLDVNQMELDFTDFNTTAYGKKWLHSNVFIDPFLKFGLKVMDRATTPIIVRTKWGSRFPSQQGQIMTEPSEILDSKDWQSFKDMIDNDMTAFESLQLKTNHLSPSLLKDYTGYELPYGLTKKSWFRR